MEVNQDEEYADRIGEMQDYCRKVHMRYFSFLSTTTLTVIQKEVNQVCEAAGFPFKVRATIRRGPTGNLDLLHLVRM